MQVLKKFINQYIYVILFVFALVGFQAWNWFKFKPKQKFDEAKKVLSTFQTSTKNLQKIALDIAHNLGTAYNWWDVRAWSENDKKVYDLVKQLTKNEFRAVSALYFEVYTKGNNLDLDLAKLLDKKYYEQLNNIR